MRLTDVELDRFQTAAHEVGMSVQRYLVETVLTAETPARRPLLGREQRVLLATFLATRRSLAGAANNLNQLTRWSHAHEQAANGIEAAIAAVGDAAARLRLDVAALADSLHADANANADDGDVGEWEVAG